MRELEHNGRRRISQFQPQEFETRGVLAGRYRGRDIEERPLLTHTAWPESEDAICGTIKPGGLADTFLDPAGNALPPTCPRCLAKDPRFKRSASAKQSCPECSYEDRTGEVAPVDHSCEADPEHFHRPGAQHEPNEDLGWREVYGREYRAAESRGLEPWQAREEAARIAWSDYEARTGRKRFERNRSSYYVWVIPRGSDEPSEGPRGPYGFDGAKTFARIGATEGANDRAVSRGQDPTAASFEILRRYQAGTGARIL